MSQNDSDRRSSALTLLGNAAHLYRVRVREQPLQELLALLGIAAGVALLFAVQVASSSISGAVAQLSRGVAGNASLELVARGPNGVDQSLVAQVRRLPDVEAAAPVLERRIVVSGPSGAEPLTLVGVDQRLEHFGGALARRFARSSKGLQTLGFFLTAESAHAIGVSRGDMLTIETGAVKQRILLAGVLGPDEIGELSDSPIALAPLGQTQKISGLAGRVSRILVVPMPERKDQALDALRQISRDRLDARPTGTDAKLMASALAPDRQSSAFFSAIAVGIALLFAYNAMLLATARRQRLAASLRMLGANRATVIVTLVFEALVLGLAASMIGIVLGDLLLQVAFNSVPRYLMTGFPIGSQRIVELFDVTVAFVGGMAAALVASAKPAIDTLRASPGDALRESTMTSSHRRALGGSARLLLGIGIICVASVGILLEARLTPIATVTLIAGFVIALEPVITLALARVANAARNRGGIGLSLAAKELAGNPARAAALAVIAGGTIAATISVGGARQDLERGILQMQKEFYAADEVWLTPGGASNTFLTMPFDQSSLVPELRRINGVKTVGVHRGGFLDFHNDRVLLEVRPSGDPRPIPPSQIVVGDTAVATARVRGGGWLGISEQIAARRGLGIGDRITIPTPSGKRSFRIAALTANHGWPSGAIMLNSADYVNAWGSDEATGLILRVNSNASVEEVRDAAQVVAGPNSALTAKTGTQMDQERRHELVQGLSRIRTIASLLLIAGVLAIVTAMFAAVWQRRARMASLRALGLYRGELLRTLFAETGMVVILGGLSGLAFGLYLQAFADRWVEQAISYQAPFEPAFALGVRSLIQTFMLAMVATALPAYLATRVAARMSERV
ncbi:MAG: FtsX-like permease family protein [Actinobacteria bacterium]|nr:FtsX-like permease family protein [Actinomycetota bacterium]